MQETTLYRAARFDKHNPNNLLPAQTVHLAVTHNNNGHHLFTHHSNGVKVYDRACATYAEALDLLNDKAEELGAAGFRRL